MLLIAVTAAALAQAAQPVRTAVFAVRVQVVSSCVVDRGQAACQGAKTDRPLAIRREHDPVAGQPRLVVDY